MQTADWPSIATTKVLLIGESSTLQWKDEIIEHVMFLDYYFEHIPYDLGERSRYSEAKAIFDYIKEISAGVCSAENVHGTVLTNQLLPRPPKGKHIFVDKKSAEEGVKHLKELLSDHPTIEYVFVMGMQTNYYLQLLGFYNSGELSARFLKGAEPRRVGVSNSDPYYQPVDAKPFRELCFNRYTFEGDSNVAVIPILPIKSYPLTGADVAHFSENLENLKNSFKI